MLSTLDQLATQMKSSMSMTPSEYFERHCAVSPSSIHLAEVAMRNEIGVHKMMFGMDYPHHEGTWPNTKAWIQVAFAGVSEPDARMILGENAIDFYSLDRTHLSEVSDRIGPSASEVLVQTHTVAPSLVEHFDKRAGFNRAAEPVDANEVGQAFERDLAGLVAAGR